MSEWDSRLLATVRTGDREDTRRLLESRPAGSHPDVGYLNALHVAVDRRDHPMVRLMLEHRRNANLMTRLGKGGQTVLHKALSVSHPDVDVVMELIQQSTSPRFVNCQDHFGRTALFLAAEKGATDIARALLENGANVDTPDWSSATPLHIVLRTHEKQSVVDLLFGNKAEVNTKDTKGDSPLHAAAKKRNRLVIGRLLELGADPETVNNEGRTPRDIAEETMEPDQVRDLFTMFIERPHEYRPTTKPVCTGGRELVSGHMKAYIRFYYRPLDAEAEMIREDSGLSGQLPPSSFSWTRRVRITDLVYKPDTMKELEDDYCTFLERKLERKVEDEDREGIWKWIHIPATNMTWVKDLIWRLTQSWEDVDKEHVWKFFDKSTSEINRESDAGKIRMPHVFDSWEGMIGPHKKPRKKEKRRGVGVEIGEGSWRGVATLRDRSRISMVFPYIDFDTEHYLQRKLPFEEQSRRQRKQFGKWQFQRMMQLEELYPSFSGQSGLQAARTLDESYYYMLDEKKLDRRAKDQVIYKWSAERCKKPEEEPQESDEEDSHSNDPDAVAKLLMVDQMWLWKLDDKTVITAISERWHTGAKDTVIDTVRQGGIKDFFKPEQLIEHILFECATFLDEYRYAGLGTHILDVFEGEIARLTDEETTCFSSFGKFRKDKNVVRSMDREIDILYQVKDIRDELHMIRRVLRNQEKVLEKFSHIFWGGSSHEAKMYRAQFLQDCSVDGLLKRIERLDEDANRTQDALDYLIQVKQAQSSLDEAETAGKLNNYIFLFTVVTIIFTPLSFMTSLFAIPITSFPMNESGELFIPPDWVTSRMIAGELASIGLIFLVIGVYYFLIQPAMTWLRQRVRVKMAPLRPNGAGAEWHEKKVVTWPRELRVGRNKGSKKLDIGMGDEESLA